MTGHIPLDYKIIPIGIKKYSLGLQNYSLSLRFQSFAQHEKCMEFSHFP